MQDLCLNFAGRYFNREQGFNSSRLDRRYVHSRFRMVRSITTQRGVFFTSCDFTACATGVIVGVDSGEVRVYSNKSGYTYTTQACQDGGVANVKTSKNGALLLTSASRLPPKSKIWNIIEDNQFTLKMEFFEEDYVEFSKLNEDKILATSEGTATIYDAHTGQLCATFHPSVRNRCMQNRATFSPCDQLILSDGVLWDFNSGDEIHIFDMEHQAMSGVFHPNGVEIVANGKVWDIRTFNISRTVPELKTFIVTFSPQNVIYGRLTEKFRSPGMDKTLKTIDSCDYSTIKTFDVNQKIFDFSVNKYGSQIALVENSVRTILSRCESAVRLYEVGKR